MQGTTLYVSPSAKHFDKVAAEFDYSGRANPISRLLKIIYLSLVTGLIKKIVLPDKNVLDFGCGTGDILNSLKPELGMGLDPSREMINLAKKKFGEKYKFLSSLKGLKQSFDYVMMVDVIEHLESPQKTLQSLRKYVKRDGRLVISYVDSSWEFFLNILEGLHLKIAEGPHNRINVNELIGIAKKAGFRLKLRDQKFLVSLLVFER